MKATIKIESVKEVPGFIPPFDNPNRYNGSSIISRANDYKSLLIKGTINQTPVSFFSPTICIHITSGFLNHSWCDENSWFECIDGEQTAHRGLPMFDEGKIPNVAIDNHTKVICKIKVGDEYQISYSEKGERNGVKLINRVKII